MDEISETRLNGVHPVLARKVRELCDKLYREGIYIRVVQGFRTVAEQDALFEQGRTKQGPIVTNAKGGFSYHNYGLAVDLVPSRGAPDQPFDPDWDHSHPAWGTMIREAAKLGLNCGANWMGFTDYPHFQLTGTLPTGRPPESARAILMNRGPHAVWEIAGINA